jgi:hypothetical protein
VGEWQCEVGGLVRDAFETDSATISVEVKSKFLTTFYLKKFLTTSTKMLFIAISI